MSTYQIILLWLSGCFVNTLQAYSNTRLNEPGSSFHSSTGQAHQVSNPILHPGSVSRHPKITSYMTDTELNVLSYEVSIVPAIEKGELLGTVTIRFQLPTAKSTLLLDAGNLQIDSVQGQHAKNYTRTGKKLRIALEPDRTLTTSITIYYHGSPKKGLLFNATKKEAYTVFFTSEWMICNDTPDDKATIALSISLTKNLDCVANGNLISTREEEERRVYQWQQDVETSTYTYGFAIGKFQKSSSNAGAIGINNYSPNHDAETLSQVFQETPAMLAFFEEKSGISYDQKSYSQVLIGNHYQEHAGFSLLKDAYGQLVLKDSTETNLISHELAHQWWGNRITCESWQHFWLNEAFATYFSAAYNEHRFGRDKYLSDINAYRKVYQQIKERGNDKPLVFPNWNNPSRDDRNLVYFKGAYVLHLLREQLGDEVFWGGIRSYSSKYFDLHVNTQDFQRAMEQYAGQDLSVFFNQWVYKVKP